ncbi:MAG: sugar O-acetyltransferase [Alphaproteobacteria bacterium]|nr:sugar O-acetyltransferase [Alphaproteobacteria bacterium]
MVQSERQKMESGQWYCCIDPELEELRMRSQDAVHQHNHLPPRERDMLGPKLRTVLGAVGENVRIEAMFHCAYGKNIFLGDAVYLNVGCVVLDTARVDIGAGSMLGPTVQIYCAEHSQDTARRAAGYEIAKPVTIGENVWIGGGAIIMPGVTIGNGAIVGSGSVVTRDVAAGATVVGNPARDMKLRDTGRQA